MRGDWAYIIRPPSGIESTELWGRRRGTQRRPRKHIPGRNVFRLKGLIARGEVHTQADAARALGISRERVRQLVRDHDLDLGRLPTLFRFRCQQCGTKVRRKLAMIDRLKYPHLCGACGRKQRARASLVTVTCTNCGAEREYEKYNASLLTSGLCLKCYRPPSRKVTVACSASGRERTKTFGDLKYVKTSLCATCYRSVMNDRMRNP